MNKRPIPLFLTFLFFCAFIISNGKVFAFNEFYSDNNILFYNENVCSSPSSNITSSSSGYDRLKEAVRLYSQTAMDMQREYGTPWEIVLAQMQKESQTGTAGIAVSGATNNWLGITGEGDAGSWTSAKGRQWAKYTSVDASIKDWSGPRVLRNGIYDDAFKNLDPNSYNLDAFLTVMLSHYAPNSDGNNETAYKQDVLSFINGPIASVRAEKGWPSSAELAKNENIAIGGKHPLGSKTSTAQASTSFDSCVGAGAVAGNIQATALGLALSAPIKKSDHKVLKSDATQAYQSAKPQYSPGPYIIDGVDLSFTDCGRFVATVMKSSGADPNYPEVGTSEQYSYVSAHPEKYNILNNPKYEDLVAGDIVILSSGGYGHTLIFTGQDNYPIAEASLKDRVPSVQDRSALNWTLEKGPIIARIIKNG